MELLAANDSLAALSATLQHLAVVAGAGDSVQAAEAARLVDVKDEDPWNALALALPRLGLRGTGFSEETRSAVSRARPDMPLVCRVDRGLARGWVVVEAARGHHVRAWSSAKFLPNGWVPIDVFEARVGRDVTNWVRIEPILGPSMLGSGDDRGPLFRLLGLLRVERGALGVVVVYAIAVGILSLATPLAIQVLINWLAFGGLYQPVLFLGAALLACLTLAAVLMAAQRYAVELVQRRLFVRAVSEVGARLSRVRISALDDAYGPELANRFFDVLTLQKASKTLLIDGLTAALQATVGLLLLALYHPYLLVFDIAVVALAALALIPWLRRGQDTALGESKAKYAVAAWLEETARHPLLFKLGGQELAESRLEIESLRYLEARTAHFRSFFAQYIGMLGVQVVVQVGLLLTCGWLVLDGQLTLGQLVAAEFIVASALAGLTKFTEKLETVYDLLAGVDKLGALLDLPFEAPVGAVPRRDGRGAEIELQQVSFRFPGGRQVFDGAQLDVPAGGRLAIIGGAGCGKSVLADLIVGVRQPDEGSVWRDGAPMDGLLREMVYAHTQVLRPREVLQASVRLNLTMGRGEIDDARVWRALRTVGLDGVVSRLADGLDTTLGPGGTPLSTTSVRRMLLARGLIAAPDLLVVDGVLDGLQPRDREPLIRALMAMPRTTTVIVTTEDPTIANRMERVFEIREGGLHGRPRLSTV